MKWSGLIRKLMLGIVIIEVMMLSILVYNSVRLINSTHAKLFERTVNEEVALLSSLLVSGLSVLDRALISENLHLFSKQENVVYATVYDRRNRVMAKVGAEPDIFNTDSTFLQAESDGVYDTEVKIKLDDIEFGYLRAGFSIEEISALSDKAKFQNTSIALTEILLTILATIFIGVYLVRRITLLQKGARSLQEGNYGYHIPATSNDELGELADAFNKLGESLASSNQSLLEKQDEIQKKALRFSSLLNSVNAIIFEATLNPFSISYVNKEAEKLLGYPLSDWKKPNFLTGIASKECSTHLTSFFDNPESENFSSFDYCVTNKNGDLMWLRQVTSIEKSTDQYVINGILIDITKEKYNTEVERSRDIALAENRTKNLFLANMSHELRTPLNAIIGYTELLTEENNSDETIDRETVHNDLNKISRSARHLLSLINEVLDISLINSGKFEPNITQFNTQNLLQNITDIVNPLANKNNNRFTVTIEDTFTIHSDFQRLCQVVVNVCANACKFTTDGDISLSIGLKPENDNFYIKVTDTGMGIKPEEIELIFQEFSRTEDVSNIEGTGLGLCLSQKLCKIMGGEIEVSSQYGSGSTFTIFMPLLVKRSIRTAI